MFVTKKEIFKLFTETNLLDTKEIPFLPINNNTTSAINIYDPNKLTPISKLIYDSVDTNEKERLLLDFKKDDINLNLLDLDDPDYIEKLENNRLGFYMEDFVCHYFKCPNCMQKTLKKYAISNMPVVDVICTNYNYHIDKNETFLFQIKISTSLNNYFSKNNKYILIGSKKYGYNSHVINGADQAFDKQLLINYICLQLDQIADNTYNIDKRNSFILIPDAKKNINNHYYEYIQKQNRFNRSAITWNINLVGELGINNYCDNFIVNTNTVFSINKILSNPYSKKFSKISKKLMFGGYYYKYLKYKSKYNYLKLINNQNI